MANSILTDTIGYIALATNLYSMSAKGEYKLRILSAIANTIYIVYGLFLSALPIIIGALVAVMLHIYRLKGLKKESIKHNIKTVKHERSN